MYWNKPMETMEREQMREIQSARLVAAGAAGLPPSAFLPEQLQKAGLLPDEIRSLDDLGKLPFITKQDMRDKLSLRSVCRSQRRNRPPARLKRPPQASIRWWAYTSKDLGIWSEVMACTLTAAGASKQSFIQVAYGYGLFTGGLGVHYGAEAVGASVIPVSSGNTRGRSC